MANEAKVAQLPQARKMEPGAEELAALKAKWGEVFYMRIADAAVVVRAFNEVEFDRFQSQVERSAASAGGMTQVRATKDLLAACVVWSSEPLESIVARRPAYGKKFFLGLVEWAGSGDDLEKKEL